MQTAQLEFRIGSDTDEDGKPTGELVLTGKKSTRRLQYQQSDTGATEPVVQPAEKRRAGRLSNATKKQLNTGTISIWLDDQMISNPR